MEDVFYNATKVSIRQMVFVLLASLIVKLATVQNVPSAPQRYFCRMENALLLAQ
jgi:hypothetical protein